jgi:dihydroorotate dehydrogenase
MGLTFVHPLGVAAGFDKNAIAVLALQELGFSHVEVGTVTPRPQEGNPKPRVWRFPEAEALVNALGFPGEGMKIVGERLRVLRASGRLRIPVGINVGKNRDTRFEDAVNDYLAVMDELHDVGDYFVINVSSPNTPGLRDLQAIEYLRPLVEAVSRRVLHLGQTPLLLKIAPDLADREIAEIARLCKELAWAGIVAGNTTIRRELVHGATGLDRGGLSGEPLYPRTLEMIRLLRQHLAPEQVIIAAGGISSASRLQECLSAGANLAQVYTAFIYSGPQCARRLLEAPR